MHHKRRYTLYSYEIVNTIVITNNHALFKLCLLFIWACRSLVPIILFISLRGNKCRLRYLFLCGHWTGTLPIYEKFAIKSRCWISLPVSLHNKRRKFEGKRGRTGTLVYTGLSDFRIILLYMCRKVKIGWVCPCVPAWESMSLNKPAIDSHLRSCFHYMTRHTVNKNHGNPLFA